MGKSVTYTVEIHHDPEHGYEAAIKELPGCFAAGWTLDELYESLEEGIGLYLSELGRKVEVRVERGVGDEEPTFEERRTFELCDA